MIAPSKPHLSIIIPVYGCQACLTRLYNRLCESLKHITSSYEMVFINDASPDHSWAVIQRLAEQDERVRGVHLSRNFGQHQAITCGIDFAEGEWVVVMDCDLQDQPEEIVKLYVKAQKGYDIVFGRRAKRRDGLFKRMQSRLFYGLYGYFTETAYDHTIANFSICSRQVANKISEMREQSRSYPLFLKWLGFKWTTVDIAHAERDVGKSSYNLRKLLHFAADSIVSQSNKPLRLSIKFGFLIAFCSFLYGCFLIYKYFFLYQPVAGWTSVMVSIYFIGGLLFANLGVLGLYLGKIFDEAKGRPLYVVQQTIGFEPKLESYMEKEVVYDQRHPNPLG